MIIDQIRPAVGSVYIHRTTGLLFTVVVDMGPAVYLRHGDGQEICLRSRDFWDQFIHINAVSRPFRDGEELTDAGPV